MNLVDPSGLREYNPTDLPDLLVTPFQAHAFKEVMQLKFMRMSRISTCPVKQAEWQKLAEDYSWFRALFDMYRFDYYEALEHYTHEIGGDLLFWGTGAGIMELAQ